VAPGTNTQRFCQPGHATFTYEAVCVERFKRVTLGRRRPEKSICQRAVWAVLVVVASPLVEFRSRIGQIQEHLHVQAFIAQPTVETFDVAILNGSARTNKI
jgi:hypothetical protein